MSYKASILLFAPNSCRLPPVRLTAFQIEGLQQLEQWFLWCRMVGKPERKIIPHKNISVDC